MSGFKVKIFTTDGSQVLSFSKSHLLVGSAEHCDIQLTGGEIAPEHLRIWSDSDHLWGQDLGSKHGTFLNGQGIQALRPVMFHEADLFRLGISDVSLAFSGASSGPVRAPVVNLSHETTSEQVMQLKEQLEQLRFANARLQNEIDELRDEQTQKTMIPDAEEEEEISQVKHNALQEIQAMKEAESRHFEVWKQECVDEMDKVVSKVFRKADPKMAAEDLAQDVTNALRAHLLGEKTPAPRRRRQSHEGWQRTLMTFLILAALVGATWVYVKRTAHRAPASVILVPSSGKVMVENRSGHNKPAKNTNP